MGVREATLSHPLRPLLGCPAVAVAPSGAAVVAAATLRRGKAGMRLSVAVREPGGAFARAVRYDAAKGRSVEPVVAIAPDGTALVAWIERLAAPREVAAVRVARRPPGGVFGPPVTLQPPRRARDPFSTAAVGLQAALDAAGTATIAWGRQRRPSDPPGRSAAVDLRAPPPGPSTGVAEGAR